MKKNHPTSDQERKKHQIALLGERNPHWQGGISEYPNHALLKKIRLEILKRAKGKCEICGEPGYQVHHIDLFKNNHSPENLIYLCNNCHRSLHRGETSFGRPPILYKGMTIKEICEKTGLSYPTVYLFIKGKKNPTENNLARINLATGQ